MLMPSVFFTEFAQDDTFQEIGSRIRLLMYIVAGPSLNREVIDDTVASSRHTQPEVSYIDDEKLLTC